MANEQNLIVFSKDDPEARARAREQGRKGGLKRAENARRRKALEARASKDAIEQLEDLTSRFNREDLGRNAAAVANMLMGRVVSGEIEVTGKDVASLVEVLVNIARLEAGQATSHTVSASMDTDAVLARIDEIRSAHATGSGEQAGVEADSSTRPGVEPSNQ